MSTLPQAKVAVVTRTKNRPVLLRRAIDSVLSQTFEDYVLVVVNDAGDRAAVERCVAEVADFARGRIHVVHNETSDGREAAMNAGVRAADSSYIVVLDDDDTWSPDFLERTVEQLEGSQHVGIATRSAVIYETLADDAVTEISREVLAAHLHDITLFEMIRRNYMPTNSFLYRRTAHDSVGMYDETLPVLADWDFYLRLLQRFSIGFIDGVPLAFWHHRQTSTGDLGNSVIAAKEDHRDFDRTIRDRYLRQDVAARQNLGSLLYTTELLDRLQKDASSRSDHISRQVHELDKVTRDVYRMTDEIVPALEGRLVEIRRQLVELNSNAVTANNRFVTRFGDVERDIDALRELVYSQTPRARVNSYRRLIGQLARKALRR